MLEQVQHDVKSALKAGEKERVHALRLIVNELQKAAKENGGDDVDVLQRERKRRLEAAEAYRDGGRTDLADAEEREAEIIAGYLPEQLSDEELGAIVGDAVAESGASSPQEMGKVMALVMPKVKGRADGKRVSARRQGEADPVVRVQLELPNDVAAELAGPGDLVMKTLEEHLDCEVFLRGNVLTLDGEDDDVTMGRTVVRELTDLVRLGHEIAPGTIEAIAGALDRHETPSRILEDVVWRHRGLKVAPKTVNQKRYVDAIRRSTITVGIGPAGTGKSFLAVAMAVAALSRREVNRIVLTRPAVEAGERLGFLPGDIAGQGRPLPAPALRRPLRHARAREGQPAPGARRDRGGAAGIHARADAQRLFHHPRRGPEHEPRADQDVPHAARLQLEDGRDRRRHAGRPARRTSAPASS